MNQELSRAEADLMLEDIQKKQLLQWYNKWKDRPWLYAVSKFVYKLPLYLLIWVAVSFEQVIDLINNPINYFEQRAVYIFLGFIMITYLHRINWNHNAVKFYFNSKINPSFPKVKGDSLISKFGARAEEKIPGRYERWIDKKLFLQCFFALLLPVTFFLIIYLLKGISGNDWNINKVIGGSESIGIILIVIGTFMLFGIALGYGLWRQIKDDYILLNKAKNKL